MKLEATKFRPREVVKHVLQTAAASLQKMLTLEGHVSEDVPIEVRTLPWIIHVDVNFVPLFDPIYKNMTPKKAQKDISFILFIALHFINYKLLFGLCYWTRLSTSASCYSGL